MKVLDRYILKGFAFSFVAVLVSMLGLTIMVDMVVNIDEFAESAAGQAPRSALDIVGSMASYYLWRSFEFFQWLSGPALLVGGAFALARLSRTNEIVALKASGISVYRLLVPIIVAGMVVSGLYIVNQELVIPNIIDHLVAKRSVADTLKGFQVQYVRDSNNNLFAAPRFLPSQQAMVARIVRGPDNVIQQYDPVRIVARDPRTDQFLYAIRADRATYDPQRHGWKLVNGVKWWPAPQQDVEAAKRGGIVTQPIDFFASDLTPRMLRRQKDRDYVQYLSFRQIFDLVHSQALMRADAFRVVMHQHLSKPILNLVVLLLGLPFVIGQEGKSAFVSIVLCIGLFVLVMGTEYAAAEFGNEGHIRPVIAAYLPVLLFTPVAIFSLDRMRT